MRILHLPLTVFLLTCGFLCPSVASAQLVTMETVNIEDPGNLADPLTGYGAVAGRFAIGKYEVTLGQYTAFLNAVATTNTNTYIVDLYNEDMEDDKVIGGTILRTTDLGTGAYVYSAIGDPNRPVPWVTWFDAARFANWMHNGATASASTETGAYTLNGATNGKILKNPGATWWIPNEDEWYKAAYYKGGGKKAGYWRFPTASDAQTLEAPPTSAPNSANYNGILPEKAKLTAAGAYSGSPSPYGTFDQAGNLWEWTDTVLPSPSGSRPDARIVRGGSWSLGLATIDSTTRRDYDPGFYQDDDTGFRLATLPGPEPDISSVRILPARKTIKANGSANLVVLVSNNSTNAANATLSFVSSPPSLITVTPSMNPIPIPGKKSIRRGPVSRRVTITVKASQSTGTVELRATATTATASVTTLTPSIVNVK